MKELASRCGLRLSSRHSPEAKSSIQFLVTMLRDAKTAFDQVAAQAGPSRTLSAIFNTCLRAPGQHTNRWPMLVTGKVKDINTELDKSKSASAKLLAKDSEKAKKWQSDFDATYRKASTLAATARSMPSAAGNGPSRSRAGPLV